MTSLMESISSTYTYLFEELCYPDSRNWPLVGSPLPVLGIVMAYTYFCTRLGPQFMKNKEPYNLKIPLFLYNLLQVLVNFYMCYEATIFLFSREFSVMCQNLEDPGTYRAKKAVSVGYIYYMVKYLDLLDTVFFVFRKSYRQITVLHLHHHMIMPIAAWLGMTYFPGGSAVIVVFLNSFVHTFMYTYYLLAGLGDEYKKHLWWKKYVTILQLTQFLLDGLHSLNSMFYKCGYPTILKVLIFVYTIIFLKMFGQFYYNTYIIQNKKKESNNNVNNGIKQKLN